MKNTTPIQPYCKVLAETDHMGYNIDLTELKCVEDSYEWNVPYEVTRYLKTRLYESWVDTCIYHMKCTLRYRHYYRVPSNIISYRDRITKKLVYYCEICDPYLSFKLQTDFTHSQPECAHTHWFSLYIDQV